MDARLIEILACPVCKGPLKYQRDSQLLVCRMDRLAYPIRDDVPVMLEEEARQLAAMHNLARLALTFERHCQHQRQRVFARAARSGKDERMGQAAGRDSGE